VGHDILLARHGNHISAMRVDRGSGRVVAYLDDGSTDSAPNVICPGLRMPHGLRGILREDWRLLAVATGCCAGFAGVMFAAATALAGATEPGLSMMLAAYSAN